MKIKITEAPLNLQEAIQEVVGPELGAVVTFTGCVRASENGTPIEFIRYEAYRTMAQKRLQKIVQTAFEIWAARVAVHHRIGKVGAGQASVVIAAAACHRREAFDAAQFAIEEIKSNVPIWKVEFSEDKTCASPPAS